MSTLPTGTPRESILPLGDAAKVASGDGLTSRTVTTVTTSEEPTLSLVAPALEPDVTSPPTTVSEVLSTDAAVSSVDGETEVIRLARVVLDDDGNPVVTDDMVEETAYFREDYYEEVTPFGEYDAGQNSNTETIATTTTIDKEVIDAPAVPSFAPDGPTANAQNFASTFGTPIDAAPAVVSEEVEQTELTTTTYAEDDVYLSPGNTTTSTATARGVTLDNAALSASAPLINEALAVDSTVAPTPMPVLSDLPPTDTVAQLEPAALDAPLATETVASRPVNKRLVVIAVDDSTASTHAVNWALKQLLHPTRDHLAILTVAAYKTHGLLGHASLNKSIRREQKAELQAQRILDHFNDVVSDWQTAQAVAFSYEMVSMKAADNKVRDVIVDYVRDVSADLLVMGGHAGGAFKRAVVGSTSTYCLHHAAIPVIVANEDGTVNAV
ncbi:hypothetical protein RI367_004565 [Sorochytrium milnesiophthora]